MDQKHIKNNTIFKYYNRPLYQRGNNMDNTGSQKIKLGKNIAGEEKICEFLTLRNKKFYCPEPDKTVCKECVAGLKEGLKYLKVF